MRGFLVAGEASADNHAFDLLTELKAIGISIEWEGVGGNQLESLGMKILVSNKDLSLVGISEWADRFWSVFGLYRKLVRAIKTNPPDFAVLIDMPDLNLLLAKHLKKLGVPIIYYVSPQLWAWRRYRIHKIKKLVSKMLVILPFEEKFYRSYGVDATYVGHPLTTKLSLKDNYRSQSTILKSPRVAVLPGSRRSEIAHHTPVLKEVLSAIQKKYPNAEFQIPLAPTLDSDCLTDLTMQSGVKLMRGKAEEVLRWADVALVSSGTATLETALLGTPQVVFYKFSKMSQWINDWFVKFNGYFSLPNIISGKKIVPELFQIEASSENLMSELDSLILKESKRKEQIEADRKLHSLLTREILEGEERSAAKEVAKFLKSYSKVSLRELQPNLA